MAVFTKLLKEDIENFISDYSIGNLENFEETTLTLPERAAPYNDPFHYFKALINEEISISPYDLSALENNMVVVEILDAARESAKTGKTVYLK